MTLGEYRVGVTFNPGGDATVNILKRAAADFIDLVDKLEENSGSFWEVERLKDLAKIHIEEAAMWAVKAATKSPV